MPRRGPVEKLSRRLGAELDLKGQRAARGKSGLLRRPYPPGQHGRRFRRTRSDYLRQLQEKQKARFYYGVTEKQFRRYVERATRAAEATGDVLVRLLETRLDNVLVRLGLAATRAQARQFVGHGHVAVGSERVDRPSYQVEPGDTIAIRPGSAVEPLAREAVEMSPGPPVWLSLDAEALAGRVLRPPDRQDVQVPFDEQVVIEFYSR
jgi:small subunit ribosomal protein S4